MRKVSIIIILISIIASCDTSKRPDSSGIKDEMAAREVKKVSDIDIMIEGEKVGMMILDSVETLFKSELLNAIQNGGISNAISYCNVNATDLVSVFEDSLGVTIRRATDKPRNQADALNADEQPIYEAYQFNPDLASTQIQKLNQEELILTKPIKINNGMCLNCHGKIGEGLTKENHDLIKSLYPEDKAIDYAIGDLRGMWSIKIPIKTVVSRL